MNNFFYLGNIYIILTLISNSLDEMLKVSGLTRTFHFGREFHYLFELNGLLELNWKSKIESKR